MAQRLHDFIFDHMLNTNEQQINWIWHRDMESQAIQFEAFKQSILSELSHKK